MTDRARETAAMIAGMDPAVNAGSFVFVETERADLIPAAIALIREGEGTTLVLPVAVAAAEGFDATQPMAWITLNVHSALDGVGLTAAVSTALADAQIAVNVIAAFHHDHLFVPEAQAARAIEVLRQAASAAG